MPYIKPNLQFNYTMTALDATAATGELVGALNAAMSTVAKFSARSGAIFHSLRTNGRKIRLYLRILNHQAKRSIQAEDHRFSDLPPQADYDSPVPPEEGTDEPFAAPPVEQVVEMENAVFDKAAAEAAGLNPDTPPRNKGGRPRKG